MLEFFTKYDKPLQSESIFERVLTFLEIHLQGKLISSLVDFLLYINSRYLNIVVKDDP